MSNEPTTKNLEGLDLATAGAHLDVSEYLEARELQQGIVWIYGEIGEHDVIYLDRRLQEIRRLGRSEVVLRIVSPGGAVYPALAMYDLLRYVSKLGLEVTAVVEGYAASAAAMIVLQAADKRLARPNARLLFHEVRRFALMSSERASDMEDMYGEMKVLHERVVALIADRSGRTPKEIEDLFMRKEKWLSAAQAHELGLIDDIL